MMQKRVLIMAVAAATVAPAAYADSANVTIYGGVDLALTLTDNGTSAAGVSGTRATQVSSQVSKIGFKGSENLGDGLSAIWQIEQQINVDNPTQAGGTATWATRNSFVGLKSDRIGTVMLGRSDTPYKLATRRLDVFSDSIADNRTLLGGGTSATGAGFHDARPNNIIAYVSPNWSGFGVSLAYVAGAEGATLASETKGKAISASATYSDGPLFASLGYQTFKFGTAPGTITGAADTKTDAWKIGVGYKIDALQLNAVYEKTSDNLGVNGADLRGRNTYYLAGKYAISKNNAIKLAYTRAGKQAGSAGRDTAASQISVGYDHSLSKRTSLYALYTKLNNGNDGAYLLSTSGSDAGGFALSGAGASPSAWSFGIKHAF